LDKMDMFKCPRAKLIMGIVVLAFLGLALMFVIVGNVQNQATVMGGLAAIGLVLTVCAVLLAKRFTEQLKRESFDDGMHVVMESVPMVCSLYDKDNNIKYCNDKAPQLFGFRDKQEYARNYASSFPEFQPDGSRSDDMAIRFIDGVIKNGSSTIEWFQKTSSDELIPLHLTCVRTCFQGENHMLEFTMDKRIELEVERKREEAVRKRMQVLLDSSPMFCTLLDEEGNILDVNKEAENLFGIKNRRELIDNYYGFCPEYQPDGTPTRQKADAEVAKALKTGSARYEWMYRRKDGTPLPTEEIVQRITVDGKNLIISYSRDLRADHAAREAEQAAQKKLQTMTDRLNGQLETQSAAITESSAAIEQMIANTRSVNNTLSRNAQNVKELQEAAVVGQSGLNEVATDFKEIARESESLLEINSVMQNIASQTNLLSMNAAIEAAHAGESGRGFAVVADEIRKLAESSSRQSKTIGGVLKKIKGSIDKITKSTDNVMNKFEAIDGGVKTVAEQENGILNAMAEQSAGSTQIMQAIAQVNDITGQVKEDARQMVEAAAKLGV